MLGGYVQISDNKSTKLKRVFLFRFYLQVYELVFYFVESIRVCYTQFADTAWK